MKNEMQLSHVLDEHGETEERGIINKLITESCKANRLTQGERFFYGLKLYEKIEVKNRA